MLTRLAVSAAERGLLPDPLIRPGIRALLRGRLREQAQLHDGGTDHALTLLEQLRSGPIAVSTAAANDQHYEVPAAFFETVLGPRLKYSSGLWPDGVTDLADAEDAMLELTALRAGLQDGQRVLDLGCGWGSFTLWAAERHRRSTFVAVSNSASQAEFIRDRARRSGLGNVEIHTADINAFDPGRVFDRIVSVEMLEHVRNHGALLRSLRSWLADDGRVFVHIFCHRRYTYLFEPGDDTDWMSRHFFTGGIMPASDLLVSYDDHLQVAEQWKVNGCHYARTLLAWLDRLDRRRDEVTTLFRSVYPEGDASRWVQRWRLFFLACAELFGYEGGDEWWVAHYLLRPR